jgi:hypothetical protein
VNLYNRNASEMETGFHSDMDDLIKRQNRISKIYERYSLRLQHDFHESCGTLRCTRSSTACQVNHMTDVLSFIQTITNTLDTMVYLTCNSMAKHRFEENNSNVENIRYALMIFSGKYKTIKINTVGSFCEYLTSSTKRLEELNKNENVEPLSKEIQKLTFERMAIFGWGENFEIDEKSSREQNAKDLIIYILSRLFDLNGILEIAEFQGCIDQLVKENPVSLWNRIRTKIPWKKAAVAVGVVGLAAYGLYQNNIDLDSAFSAGTAAAGIISKVPNPLAHYETIDKYGRPTSINPYYKRQKSLI